MQTWQAILGATEDPLHSWTHLSHPLVSGQRIKSNNQSQTGTNLKSHAYRTQPPPVAWVQALVLTIEANMESPCYGRFWKHAPPW